MFILIPTCDRHAPIARITVALLDKYFPDHPTVHLLHHAIRPKVEPSQRVQLHDRGPDNSRWLGNIAAFLEGMSDERFLLLLDDYAMCGPARADAIEAAARLMREDPAIGFFPLCWYPATTRTPRPGRVGIVTLTGRPILLQAGIWRRTWFLDLAREMDGRTSPWGFESQATQVAKSRPRDVCAIDMPEPRYLGGSLIDGFDKSEWPLPYYNLMHRGQPELAHEGFLRREGLAFPSRGLGDTVAGLAEATGLAALAHRLETATGKSCGCQGRREVLNRLVAYGPGDEIRRV